MADILVTMGNAEYGDIDGLIEHLEQFKYTGYFRGVLRVPLALGDKIFLQSEGFIWGFATFAGYDLYHGPNLQGAVVHKPNTLFLQRPVCKFVQPVDLHGDHRNHGWRYLESAKFSGAVMSAFNRALNQKAWIVVLS